MMEQKEYLSQATESTRRASCRKAKVAAAQLDTQTDRRYLEACNDGEPFLARRLFAAEQVPDLPEGLIRRLGPFHWHEIDGFVGQ